MFDIEVVVVINYAGGGILVVDSHDYDTLPSRMLAAGTTSKETANAVVASLCGFPAEPWGLLEQVGFVDRAYGPQIVLYSATLPDKPTLPPRGSRWASYGEVANDPSVCPRARELVFSAAHYKN